MTLLTIVLVLLLILIIVYNGVKSTIKPLKYPPGPKWHPFVGCSKIVKNMTKLHGSQWKALCELARIHDTNILGLKMGKELIVIVYGEENIKQVFLDKDFEGRPDNFFFKLRCLGKRMGLTFSDGPVWKVHRKFTLRNLRNVGFAKTDMEKKIQTEMLSVVQNIKNRTNSVINVPNLFSPSLVNILWTYAAGERVEDDRLKHLIQLMDERSKAFNIAGGWLYEIPWCRFIFPEWTGYSLIKKINEDISNIIEEAILKHKQHAVEGQDFIYLYLEEMKNNKDFQEEQLKVVCLDFLIAGAQITTNVLEFAILSMIRNPNLQAKIQQEIDTIIGNKTPGWSDSHKLTYTSAFILEVQRHYYGVPLLGPRRVLTDTLINGYLLPKDTTVLMSMRDLHFDPKIWEDPYEFKPERFIDKRGSLNNSERMYAFGLGSRRCPGVSLAKSFIFIILVGILQHFEIKCTGKEFLSNKPNIGLHVKCYPYSAEFVWRDRGQSYDNPLNDKYLY